MDLDSELEKLLEALEVLSQEIAVSFPKTSQSLRSLGQQLGRVCSGQLDLIGIETVTQEIKNIILYLSKADLRSKNMENVQDRIFMFQDTRHQEEIKSRTSACTVWRTTGRR